MAATPSIKVVKTMPFKGGTRKWSNRYHFLGGTPADATHWGTLMDNVVAAEALIHLSNLTIVECLGYGAGSDVPLFEKVYSTPGSNGGGAGVVNAPGEVVALARWSTAGRSTKNHPIYAYSYWHHTLVGNTGLTVDTLDATTRAVMETYAAAWISGFTDGTNTYTRATPSGHAATGAIVEEYVTHRDFPYTTSV